MFDRTGVNFISEKLEDVGEDKLNFDDKKTSRTVHKALCKYIEERFNAMLYDVHVAKQAQ